MENISEHEFLKNKIKILESEIRNYKEKFDIIIEERTGELKLSEEKFRLLFEKSRNSVLIIEDNNFVECNDAAVKVLGLKSKEEIYGMQPSKLSPEYQPDGRLSQEKAHEMMALAYKNGYHRFEWMHTDIKGNELCMDVTLTKIPYKTKDVIFTVWRDISVQKENERKLIESEKKFSSLFEQAADGILVGIKGGEIVDANESITKLTGYEKWELIGQNISVFFEKNELANSPLRYDLVKKGDMVIRERNIVRKDGISIPIEMNSKILADGRMQALFRDISKRKEAEKALISSEKKYRNIFHHSPLGIFHYNKEGVITDCNEYFVNIIGSSKDRLIGFNMFTEMKDKKLVKTIKQSLQRGESYFEGWYSSVTAEKSTFVRIFFESISNEKKEIISGVGLVEDITERKEAEFHLKESEKKYRILFENANDAIFLMDKDIFIDCNEKTLEMFACTREQIIGQPPYYFSPKYQPDGRKSKEKALEKISEALKGKPKIFEWTHTKYDGTEFYAEVNLNVFELQNKNVIQAIVRDITNRKRIEKEIILNEKKYRMLYETANDAILIMDNKVFMDCNEKSMEVFKCSKEQIVGVSPIRFSPVFQPDGLRSDEKFKILYNKLQKGELETFEWLHARTDGSTFYAEVSLSFFEMNNKQFIQSIVRDITDRKELEQKIFNAVTEAEEKERQRLASDIHDEIGPLLSSLKMYIESINETNDIQKQKYLKGQLQSLVKESITNVREVSNALSPYLLNKYGLQVAIKSFLENSKELIQISFETNLQNERFQINIETVYYRIVKELFNNTIKHADAKNVKISINYLDKELILIYEDDGKGIKKADLKTLEQKGIGLFNITNRIASINGNYKFFTDCEYGFKFRLLKEIEKLKD